MIRYFESMRNYWKGFMAVAGVLGVLCSGLAYAQSSLEDQIRERIAPVGDVCVIGESCAAGVQMASSGDSGPMDPMMVYQTYCFACHTTGANNSPVLGDAELWEPRLEQGMETLYENAINGLNDNAMPAKGLCMNCSDDEIRATVDYMIDQL